VICTTIAIPANSASNWRASHNNSRQSASFGVMPAFSDNTGIETGETALTSRHRTGETLMPFIITAPPHHRRRRISSFRKAEQTEFTGRDVVACYHKAYKNCSSLSGCAYVCEYECSQISTRQLRTTTTIPVRAATSSSTRRSDWMGQRGPRWSGRLLPPPLGQRRSTTAAPVAGAALLTARKAGRPHCSPKLNPLGCSCGCVRYCCCSRLAPVNLGGYYRCCSLYEGEMTLWRRPATDYATANDKTQQQQQQQQQQHRPSLWAPLAVLRRRTVG
jgi:hypothetical protein